MHDFADQKVTIRTATHDDLPAVLALLADAAAWLHDKELDQWQRPPRVQRIRDDLAAGNVFIAHDQSGQPVATLTMDTFADTDFWTHADDPSAALYLHRIVVARHAAGHDLGTTLLDWAAERAERTGHRWLRLDAWRTNPGLLDYYRRTGWTHLRTVDAPRRFSGALFEKPTSDRPDHQDVTIVDQTDTPG
ncbi:MAG: GNAT family N-acetyltransferase [Pseudonocardiaceae bacterium]|nr:GNAT family N-acetyltransferase [Pseudonocardiaceae bacterium]